MPLTDYGVRHVRPPGKLHIINDTDGLELFVKPNGRKKWRFRFSWNGKQQRMTLGRYPEISIKEARDRRD